MENEAMFEKIGNMRFVGGRRVGSKSNIIRSNVPTDLDENDILYLKKLGIKNVVDLRTIKERESKISCFEGREDFNVYNISLAGGEQVPLSAEDVPKGYLDMLELKQEIMKIFQIFCKGEGILYFCNAGKDRTGVITILISMLIGISKELIYEDYLESKKYLVRIIKSNKISDDVSRIIIPKREYIEEFFKLFYEKYNSIEEYLKLIGVNKEAINSIKINY